MERTSLGGFLVRICCITAFHAAAAPSPHTRSGPGPSVVDTRVQIFADSSRKKTKLVPVPGFYEANFEDTSFESRWNYN